MEPLAEGDKLPNAQLTAQDGREISLEEFRGDKSIVLFFYPRNHTPVCTKEACGFRDSYDEFYEAGAEVFGVNPGSASSHRSFADKLGLPFPLLVDRNGIFRKALGVPKTLGFLPGRVTYVIDREGVIRRIIRSALDHRKHVAEALQAVRDLN